VEDYITYKRSLGFQIKMESYELRRFAVYSEKIGHVGSLTTDIAFQWASLKPEYSRWYMARRMEIIRTFAKYICVFDPMTQMPPKGMFGKCHGRVTPYIFTHEEIKRLMKSSAELNALDGLRSRTIPIAIGLLWATGMRPSEVCKLVNDDVDLIKGRITIRETKFSKTRIIPLHETTVTKLQTYVLERDGLRIHHEDNHFLLMTGSTNMKLRSLEYAWQKIRNQLLIDTKEWNNRRPPRLYDIRHSFACHTLLNWLKQGINVNHKLIYLSTYLGHVKVADTYWYLTGTPELMQLASSHFEQFFYENGGVADEE
jgi:integrase